jgi:hypothetical protein
MIVRPDLQDLLPEHFWDCPKPIFYQQKTLFSISLGVHNIGVADLQHGIACCVLDAKVASHSAYTRMIFMEGLALAMLNW